MADEEVVVLIPVKSLNRQGQAKVGSLNQYQMGSKVGAFDRFSYTVDLEHKPQKIFVVEYDHQGTQPVARAAADIAIGDIVVFDKMQAKEEG